MRDDSTRKMHRDIKANKQKLYVLESELFELQQKTKHNKDTRKRQRTKRNMWTYQNKAGTYTESSLLRLIYVIYSHRLEHLIKDGRWMD